MPPTPSRRPAARCSPSPSTAATPGFYLDRTAPALALIAAAGAPNLRLQYDIYHAQVMEGDLAMDPGAPPAGRSGTSSSPTTRPP